MAKQPNKKPKDEAQNVTRRKINRGSTRRINKATEAVLAAIATFKAEIDLQVFVADEDGNRTGPHFLVGDLGNMEEHIREQANEISNPSPPVEADAAE